MASVVMSTASNDLQDLVLEGFEDDPDVPLYCSLIPQATLPVDSDGEEAGIQGDIALLQQLHSTSTSSSLDPSAATAISLDHPVNPDFPTGALSNCLGHHRQTNDPAPQCTSSHLLATLAPLHELLGTDGPSQQTDAAGSVKSSIAGASTMPLRPGRIRRPFDSFPLEDVLDTPHLRSMLVEFLSSQFALENLSFVEAVQSYRTLQTPQLRRRLANSIVAMFLDEDAPDSVNLDSRTFNFLKDSLDHPDEGLTADTFDRAYDVVFKLLATDSFQRFLDQPETVVALAQTLFGNQACPHLPDTHPHNQRAQTIAFAAKSRQETPTTCTVQAAIAVKEPEEQTMDIFRSQLLAAASSSGSDSTPPTASSSTPPQDQTNYGWKPLKRRRNSSRSSTRHQSSGGASAAPPANASAMIAAALAASSSSSFTSFASAATATTVDSADLSSPHDLNTTMTSVSNSVVGLGLDAPPPRVRRRSFLLPHIEDMPRLRRLQRLLEAHLREFSCGMVRMGSRSASSSSSGSAQSGPATWSSTPGSSQVVRQRDGIPDNEEEVHIFRATDAVDWLHSKGRARIRAVLVALAQRMVDSRLIRPVLPNEEQKRQLRPPLSSSWSTAVCKEGYQLSTSSPPSGDLAFSPTVQCSPEQLRRDAWKRRKFLLFEDSPEALFTLAPLAGGPGLEELRASCNRVLPLEQVVRCEQSGGSRGADGSAADPDSRDTLYESAALLKGRVRYTSVRLCLRISPPTPGTIPLVAGRSGESSPQPAAATATTMVRHRTLYVYHLDDTRSPLLVRRQVCGLRARVGVRRERLRMGDVNSLLSKPTTAAETGTANGKNHNNNNLEKISSSNHKPLFLPAQPFVSFVSPQTGCNSNSRRPSHHSDAGASANRSLNQHHHHDRGAFDEDHSHLDADDRDLDEASEAQQAALRLRAALRSAEEIPSFAPEVQPEVEVFYLQIGAGCGDPPEGLVVSGGWATPPTASPSTHGCVDSHDSDCSMPLLFRLPVFSEALRLADGSGGNGNVKQAQQHAEYWRRCLAVLQAADEGPHTLLLETASFNTPPSASIAASSTNQPLPIRKSQKHRRSASQQLPTSASASPAMSPGFPAGAGLGSALTGAAAAVVADGNCEQDDYDSLYYGPGICPSWLQTFHQQLKRQQEQQQQQLQTPAKKRQGAVAALLGHLRVGRSSRRGSRGSSPNPNPSSHGSSTDGSINAVAGGSASQAAAASAVSGSPSLLPPVHSRRPSGSAPITLPTTVSREDRRRLLDIWEARRLADDSLQLPVALTLEEIMDRLASQWLEQLRLHQLTHPPGSSGLTLDQFEPRPIADPNVLRRRLEQQDTRLKGWLLRELEQRRQMNPTLRRRLLEVERRRDLRLRYIQELRLRAVLPEDSSSHNASESPPISAPVLGMPPSPPQPRGSGQPRQMATPRRASAHLTLTPSGGGSPGRSQQHPQRPQYNQQLPAHGSRSLDRSPSLPALPTLPTLGEESSSSPFPGVSGCGGIGNGDGAATDGLVIQGRPGVGSGMSHGTSRLTPAGRHSFSAGVGATGGASLGSSFSTPQPPRQRPGHHVRTLSRGSNNADDLSVGANFNSSVNLNGFNTVSGGSHSNGCDAVQDSLFLMAGSRRPSLQHQPNLPALPEQHQPHRPQQQLPVRRLSSSPETGSAATDDNETTAAALSFGNAAPLLPLDDMQEFEAPMKLPKRRSFLIPVTTSTTGGFNTASTINNTSTNASPGATTTATTNLSNIVHAQSLSPSPAAPSSPVSAYLRQQQLQFYHNTRGKLQQLETEFLRRDTVLLADALVRCYETEKLQLPSITPVQCSFAELTLQYGEGLTRLFLEVFRPNPAEQLQLDALVAQALAPQLPALPQGPSGRPVSFQGHVPPAARVLVTSPGASGAPAATTSGGAAGCVQPPPLPHGLLQQQHRPVSPLYPSSSGTTSSTVAASPPLSQLHHPGDTVTAIDDRRALQRQLREQLLDHFASANSQTGGQPLLPPEMLPEELGAELLRQYEVSRLLSVDPQHPWGRPLPPWQLRFRSASTPRLLETLRATEEDQVKQHLLVQFRAIRDADPSFLGNLEDIRIRRQRHANARSRRQEPRLRQKPHQACRRERQERLERQLLEHRERQHRTLRPDELPDEFSSDLSEEEDGEDEVENEDSLSDDGFCVEDGHTHGRLTAVDGRSGSEEAQRQLLQQSERDEVNRVEDHFKDALLQTFRKLLNSSTLPSAASSSETFSPWPTAVPVVSLAEESNLLDRRDHLSPLPCRLSHRRRSSHLVRLKGQTRRFSGSSVGSRRSSGSSTGGGGNSLSSFSHPHHLQQYHVPEPMLGFLQVDAGPLSSSVVSGTPNHASPERVTPNYAVSAGRGTLTRASPPPLPPPLAAPVVGHHAHPPQQQQQLQQHVQHQSPPLILPSLPRQRSEPPPLPGKLRMFLPVVSATAEVVPPPLPQRQTSSHSPERSTAPSVQF